ncbi:hypothetical protein V6N13_009527 [Hibiscus sabdariffa]
MVFPSKNSVRPFPIGLVRFGCVGRWRRRRKGGGISVQFDPDSVVDFHQFSSAKGNHWRRFDGLLKALLKSHYRVKAKRPGQLAFLVFLFPLYPMVLITSAI